MSDDTLLTETEAAKRIGWSPACLRSHRERHELAQLAERLPAEIAELVRRAAGTPPVRQLKHLRAVPGTELVGEPWALASAVPEGQRLNARGIEVARALHYGRRPTEPPPSQRVDQGARYPAAQLQAWLDQHPAASDRAEMLTEDEVAELLGYARATLKVLRYQARRAALELQTRGGKGRRKGETAADHQTRRTRIGWLERQVDALPPGHKVGRVYRYRPEDVQAWLDRHPEGQHPLFRERETSRGPLLTSAQAAERMRIAASTLVVARARAGSAVRELQRLESAKGRQRAEPEPVVERRRARVERLRQLADSVPPHVRVVGEVMYQREDVKAWVRRHKGKA